MKVKMKLLLLAVIPLVAIAAITGYSSISAKTIQVELKDTLYTEEFLSNSSMLNADRDMYQALSALQEIVKPGADSGDLSDLKASFDENTQQTLERAAKAKEILEADQAVWGAGVHATSGRTIFENLDTFNQSFTQWVEQAGQAISSGREIEDFTGSTLATDFESIRENLNEAEETLDSIANNQIVVLEKRGNQVVFISAGIAVIIVFVVILFALYLIAGITKPLKKASDMIRSLSDGDLSQRINISAKDEFGDMAKQLNQMADNLSGTIQNISTASLQVAAGARQVSSSSVSLAQGATNQASSIQQLSASIEQINAQTENNAENANKASSLAETVKTKSEEGNGKMAAMLRAMEDINQSSNDISNIIKVIDDIAFQTNILALNAAVEAARAGQQGRGFAVVAEEVRSLAARSTQAASQTNTLIKGSVGKVNEGTRIANETAQSLRDITDGISKAAVLVEEISVSSREQASGISQINQGIVQISGVVQDNSAAVEESSAVSEELLGQAESLREQVTRFKLDAAPQSQPAEITREHTQIELSGDSKSTALSAV